MKKKSHGLIYVTAFLLVVGMSGGMLGVWRWWSAESVLPYERVMRFFHSWFVAPVVRFAGRADAVMEVENYRTENATLRVRLQEMERMEAENARLREALGFVEAGHGRVLASRVVSRGGGSGWWRTVRLEKGEMHGVRTGDAVVTGDGLVGRVRSTTQRTCDVMLVSDANSRIGCELEEPGLAGTRRRGILAGGGGQSNDDTMKFVFGAAGLEMLYIEGDDPPREGARVVTSGLGGGLPRGLLVGVVTGGRESRSGVYHEAVVHPAVNLRDLDLVFILQTGGGAWP